MQKEFVTIDFLELIRLAGYTPAGHTSMTI